MSLNRAAVLISEAREPKKLRIHKTGGYWIVTNPCLKRWTLNGSFEDAVEWVDTEILERLWRVSQMTESA